MPLTHAYCTLGQLKLAAGNVSDASDDQLLEIAINAASRQIDDYCHRRFWEDGAVTSREFFVTGDGSSLDFGQDDVAGLATATGVVVKIDTAGDGTYATTLVQGVDYLLLPVNAEVMVPARPYTSISLGLSGATFAALPLQPSDRPLVQITGKWGDADIPDEVTQACLLQAQQLWKSKDAVFGVAAFGDVGALRVKATLNPIAQALVDDYRLVNVG